MNWDLSNNWQALNKQISAYHFGEISVNTVIGLMIIAAILIGFFYVVRKYVVPYLGSRRAIRKTRVVIYRIEVLTWAVYTVFGLYQLLSDSIYITSAILVVVILAGFNFWRDIFAGIAFRLENKFKRYDPVRYDSYNGIIEEINPRNIQIKTDKEELVTVPFRKLSNAIFIKRQAKGKLHSAQLTLNLGAKSADEIMPKLEHWIYECPWAVDNDNTGAKVIGTGLIQLTVYAVDRESISKTEEYLRQRIHAN
ncbi:MAG: mechanosensitive ion channel family protein [Crocinitomicaceae bacterium]|nr:mechanosensitive ion channel family protein [Crocinitomicaceae bacterium]